MSRSKLEFRLDRAKPLDAISGHRIWTSGELFWSCFAAAWWFICTTCRFTAKVRGQLNMMISRIPRHNPMYRAHNKFTRHESLGIIWRNDICRETLEWRPREHVIWHGAPHAGNVPHEWRRNRRKGPLRKGLDHGGAGTSELAFCVFQRSAHGIGQVVHLRDRAREQSFSTVHVSKLCKPRNSISADTAVTLAPMSVATARTSKAGLRRHLSTTLKMSGSRSRNFAPSPASERSASAPPRAEVGPVKTPMLQLTQRNLGYNSGQVAM